MVEGWELVEYPGLNFDSRPELARYLTDNPRIAADIRRIIAEKRAK